MFTHIDLAKGSGTRASDISRPQNIDSIHRADMGEGEGYPGIN
jgi:hypothetical protein